MTGGFSSLLNVCPSVETLKYELNNCIAFVFTVLVFSLCSISKCGLQVNTLKGISDGLSKPMLRLTALKYVVI